MKVKRSARRIVLLVFLVLSSVALSACLGVIAFGVAVEGVACTVNANWVHGSHHKEGRINATAGVKCNSGAPRRVELYVYLEQRNGSTWTAVSTAEDNPETFYNLLPRKSVTHTASTPCRSGIFRTRAYARLTTLAGRTVASSTNVSTKYTLNPCAEEDFVDY